MKYQIRTILNQHSDEWARFLIGSKDELLPGESPLMDALIQATGQTPEQIFVLLEKYVPL